MDGAEGERGAGDPYQRVFGQLGLHVIDGSVMPANTGVNGLVWTVVVSRILLARIPNARAGS